MSNVVVYMSMSLDGFVAGADDGPGRGLGAGGEVLHEWLNEGGLLPDSHRPRQGGVDADVFDELMATGAVITGRNTFEYAGEWGGDHHDGVPIFVLTRTAPDHPAPGYARYATDPAEAVAQAKAAAGDRDVMMHGASAVQSLLRLGLIDGFVLSVVPLLLGRGRRLFDDLPAETERLRLVSARPGEHVLHLRYDVVGDR